MDDMIGTLFNARVGLSRIRKNQGAIALDQCGMAALEIDPGPILQPRTC
ncbi:hypothetical protein [Noviherbaspirillum soli]|nr:hypothetical protein [Noviherbaspirillum soli]